MAAQRKVSWEIWLLVILAVLLVIFYILTNNGNKGVVSNQNSSNSSSSGGNVSDKIYCSPQSRSGDACIQIYQPVCGWYNSTKVQCIKYPCAENFGNSCVACHNSNVDYWTAGVCPN